MKIDCTLLSGPCPFRQLPALQQASLPARSLESGLFLPFEGLFYHRPHAGVAVALERDRAALFHAPTHPTIGERPLPEWREPHGRVRSILLAPGLHHYSLAAPEVNEVVTEAAMLGLPVVLFQHLCDPRLMPEWLHCRPVPIPEIIDWVLTAPPCRLVLSHFFPHELQALLPAIIERPDLWVELGAYSGGEGWWEKTFTQYRGEHHFTRWLYGTGAPLRYSTRLAFTDAALHAGYTPEHFDTNARHCYGLGL